VSGEEYGQVDNTKTIDRHHKTNTINNKFKLNKIKGQRFQNVDWTDNNARRGDISIDLST
jgi:hypothetical protein